MMKDYSKLEPIKKVNDVLKELESPRVDTKKKAKLSKDET